MVDTHERNPPSKKFDLMSNRFSLKLTSSSPKDPPQSPSKANLMPSGVFLWRSLSSRAILASVRGGKFSLEFPPESLCEYCRCMDPLVVTVDMVLFFKSTEGRKVIVFAQMFKPRRIDTSL
jgi:hypothetical protein